MTRKRAIEEGKKLLKLMKGSGWKVHVWENAGWHYAVMAPHVTVYPCMGFPMKYFAMVSDRREAHSTPTAWSDDRRFTDPNKAALRAAEKAVRIATRDVKAASTALRCAKWR